VRFSVWPLFTRKWEDLLSVCQHVEATGWDGLWYHDHFLPREGSIETPAPEAWTTLTALAALTPSVRIGTLVSSNTFRHPAVLAKMAAQADIVSGGRFVLGLGAGAQENEHVAYGLSFPTLGERLRRLDEACRVIRQLLDCELTTFDGEYYRLDQAVLQPKPVQPPLPLLIGGGGEQVLLRIAARHAGSHAAEERDSGHILRRHRARCAQDPSLRPGAAPTIQVERSSAVYEPSVLVLLLTAQRASPPVFAALCSARSN
jgi:alkanesulfonate monooxygenase SsuD/methylene tetrahydromethanopterin reductase-like flavin-dependent oxidoreductase (luciferase family)